jgi:hypothetical protein
VAFATEPASTAAGLDGTRSPGDNDHVSAKPPPQAGSVSDRAALAEACHAGQPFLVFRDRDGRQQLFVLTPELASASVGRRSSSDLLLDWDAKVSRVHARFMRVHAGWEIVDEGLSSNGTFVNDTRLSARRRLGDGDLLRFGETTVTFRSPAPDQLGSPAAAETRRPAVVSLSSTQRRILCALCRPYEGRREFASPASDAEIAEEVVLSVTEVRAHLDALYAKLAVDGLRQNERRVALVERAFSLGVIASSAV